MSTPLSSIPQNSSSHPVSPVYSIRPPTPTSPLSPSPRPRRHRPDRLPTRADRPQAPAPVTPATAGEPVTGKTVIKAALQAHDPERLVAPTAGRTLHICHNTLRILCQAFEIGFDGAGYKCERRLIDQAFTLNGAYLSRRALRRERDLRRQLLGRSRNLDLGWDRCGYLLRLRLTARGSRRPGR